MNKNIFEFGGLVLFAVIISLLSSCASFGVYGSIDHVDEQMFIVNIYVPPISGGGSPAFNLQTAMKYTAKEVLKQGCNYFVIVEGGYNEQHRDISFSQYTSRNNVATFNLQSATATSSKYVVVYALPDEEEAFREWAYQEGYSAISAKHISQ
jgi:hypothetical protein